MCRYQKPYIWCLFYDESWSANSKTLTATLSHRRSIGGLTVPNQCHVILLRIAPPLRSLISLAADRVSSSSMMPKVGASRPPSRTLLQLPPPPEDPLGEFPSLRCIRRVKPCRKWCPRAWAMPGSGEPPPLAAPPPHQPHLSHPCLDQRPILDRWYPFILIKSETQIEESMTEWSTMPWTHEPRPLIQSMGPWTYSTGFLLQK
jgi:hypothetical protein